MFETKSYNQSTSPYLLAIVLFITDYGPPPGSLVPMQDLV